MLRRRLFLTKALFSVVLLCTGVYAVALFSHLARSVEQAVAENYRCILAAHEMSLALAGMEREAWAAAAKQTAASAAFTEYRRRFETNLSVQLPRGTLAGEPKLRQELTAEAGAFRQAIAHLVAATAPEQRHQVYDQEFLPHLLALNSLTEQIRDLNHNAILAATRNVRRETSEVTRLMAAGVGIALLLSIYVGFKVIRSILRPVQLLTRATRDLGEGKPAQPVPVVSKDELGDLARAFNHMAAQLQEYRDNTSEEIVRLHRTMETMIASFPDPIFVLNREGHVQLRNPAATGLASVLDLNNELPIRLRPIASKTLETGRDFLPYNFEDAIFFRLGGTGKFFLPRVVAMRDKREGILGVAVVLYDITRFRLLDAAKTNLVGTVSHELKTPLTSVRMAVHLLLEHTLGDLTARQQEMLEAARQDSERLLRILNDLLDLTRLDEGAAELRCESVAPSVLLETVAAEISDKIAEKQMKLDSLVEQDLPPVFVDVQQIGYVFTNLLTNAIKHSPPGGLIRLQAAPAEDGFIVFSVTDQGPGIPEQYQVRIFDRFFRVPGQGKTGAGLGLSIAREITVAHGGRIGVRSTPGQGSTFYVALKAASCSLSTNPEAQQLEQKAA